MTAPRSGPALSFRNIPPAIHVAFGVTLVGLLVVAIAMMLASGEGYERFKDMERWWLLDTGCNVAYSILLGLGLLELARRQVGPARTLAQIAACLGFVSLAWVLHRPLLAYFEPKGDTLRLFYEWYSRVVGATLLSGVVVLTFAADAWRRVPIAAITLVVLGVTSYWVPGIGEAIREAIGDDPMVRQIYGLGRHAVHLAALLFVIAALAARGRDPAQDPHAAAAGLRLARGALVLRIAAGIAIAALAVGGRSEGAAKLLAFASPGIVVLTMVLLAIGLQRVAAAGLAGMPRLLLSLAAALTLWWSAIQLEQLSTLIGAMEDVYRAERALQVLQWYSIAGPVVATLGLALVGSAIVAFASRRGDAELREAATGRTITFVVTTLISIWIQSRLTEAPSRDSALTMIVFAAIAALAGLAALVGLLGRAAVSIEATSGVPPARVV